ncbi:hypothetical protein BESB_036110 [Besnoitia besnoiti]|uniref:TLD protein n=1 Tax=Besnoitia besnoiti TaxID=94643 RepID=A0A2A9MMV3_BESBE|nr:hypothetical protein BESB_036110 [Besnoitia besnoiti]PFH37153.1 hypothetical protein BESB_036110 [Besnoitia besnoiti]
MDAFSELSHRTGASTGSTSSSRQATPERSVGRLLCSRLAASEAAGGKRATPSSGDAQGPSSGAPSGSPATTPPDASPLVSSAPTRLSPPRGRGTRLCTSSGAPLSAKEGATLAKREACLVAASAREEEERCPVASDSDEELSSDAAICAEARAPARDTSLAPQFADSAPAGAREDFFSPSPPPLSAFSGPSSAAPSSGLSSCLCSSEAEPRETAWPFPSTPSVSPLSRFLSSEFARNESNTVAAGACAPPTLSESSSLCWSDFAQKDTVPETSLVFSFSSSPLAWASPRHGPSAPNAEKGRDASPLDNAGDDARPARGEPRRNAGRGGGGDRERGAAGASHASLHAPRDEAATSSLSLTRPEGRASLCASSQSPMPPLFRVPSSPSPQQGFGGASCSFAGPPPVLSCQSSPVVRPASSSALHAASFASSPSGLFSASPLPFPPPAGATAAQALAVGAFPVIAQAASDGVLLFPAYVPAAWVDAFEFSRWPCERRERQERGGEARGRSRRGGLGRVRGGGGESGSFGTKAERAEASAAAASPGGSVLLEERTALATSGASSKPLSFLSTPVTSVAVIEYGPGLPPSPRSLQSAVAGLLGYFRGDKAEMSLALNDHPRGRERRHSFSISPYSGLTRSPSAIGGSPAGVPRHHHHHHSLMFSIAHPTLRRRSSSSAAITPSTRATHRSNGSGKDLPAVAAAGPGLQTLARPCPEAVHSALKYGIRYGVPDGLKRVVWLVANDAYVFLNSHEQLYRNALQQTFGDRVPSTLKGKCPTFSAGLIGLQEDISGKQTRLKDLEFETDTPLASWRAHMHPSEGGAASGAGDAREGPLRDFFLSDLTESTADLFRTWFNASPRGGERSQGSRRAPARSPPHQAVRGPEGGTPGGGVPYYSATAPTPWWLSLFGGRRHRVTNNPLGQAIRDDLNFWPAPPSPSASGAGAAHAAGERGESPLGDANSPGGAGGERADARGPEGGVDAPSGGAEEATGSLGATLGGADGNLRNRFAGVALMHGLGSFASGDRLGRRSTSDIDEARVKAILGAGRDAAAGGDASARSVDGYRRAGGGADSDAIATLGAGYSAPTRDDAETASSGGREGVPAWLSRMEADVEALKCARRESGKGRPGPAADRLFVDYMNLRRSDTQNGDESLDVEKQKALAKELFGRRDSSEVQDFRRYMRDTHHRHMRHVERMRRARERSRERLSSSFAASSLSSYLAATASDSGALASGSMLPRRFNTASSLDSMGSFTPYSPATAADHPVDRNLSPEDLPPYRSNMYSAFSDYNLFTAQAAARQYQASILAAANHSPSPKTGFAHNLRNLKNRRKMKLSRTPSKTSAIQAPRRGVLSEDDEAAHAGTVSDSVAGILRGQRPAAGPGRLGGRAAGDWPVERERKSLFGRKKKDGGAIPPRGKGAALPVITPHLTAEETTPGDLGALGAEGADGVPILGPIHGRLDRSPSAPTTLSSVGFHRLVKAESKVGTPRPNPGPTSRLPWKRSRPSHAHATAPDGETGCPAAGKAAPGGTPSRAAPGGKKRFLLGHGSGGGRGEEEMRRIDTVGAASDSSHSPVVLRQPLGSAPVSQEEGREVEAAALAAKKQIPVPAPAAAAGARPSSLARWALFRGAAAEGETPKSPSSAHDAGGSGEKEKKAHSVVGHETDERDKAGGGAIKGPGGHGDEERESGGIGKKLNFGFFKKLFFHPHPFGHRRTTTDDAEAEKEPDSDDAGWKREAPSFRFHSSERLPPRLSEDGEEGEDSVVGGDDGAAKSPPPARAELRDGEASTSSRRTHAAGSSLSSPSSPASALRPQQANSLLTSWSPCCCAANATQGRLIGAGGKDGREGGSEGSGLGYSRASSRGRSSGGLTAFAERSGASSSAEPSVASSGVGGRDGSAPASSATGGSQAASHGRGAQQRASERGDDEDQGDAMVFRLPPSVDASNASTPAGLPRASPRLPGGEEFEYAYPGASSPALVPSGPPASLSSSFLLFAKPTTAERETASVPDTPTVGVQQSLWSAALPGGDDAVNADRSGRGAANPGKGDPSKGRRRLHLGLRLHKPVQKPDRTTQLALLPPGLRGGTPAFATPASADDAFSLPAQLVVGAGSAPNGWTRSPAATGGFATSLEASRGPPLLSPAPDGAACAPFLGPLAHPGGAAPPSPSFRPAASPQGPPGLLASRSPESGKLSASVVSASPIWLTLQGARPGASGVSADANNEYRRQLKKGDVYELEDVTEFHVLLTEEGKEKARRLLWCLNALHGAIEFCPVLPPLACVLLLYFEEDATYVILHCLLKAAVQKERNNHDAPFMPFRRKDFVRFVKVITATISHRLPRLYAHLRSLTIDVAAWVARGVQDGFARMLPFDFVLRIYGAFLYEGANVFYRHCVALLKLLEPSLLACTNYEAAEDVLYNCGDDPAVTLSGLSKTAYRYKLRVDAPFHKLDVAFPTPYLMTTRMRQFHRPRLRHESRILQPRHWEAVWNWLPENQRMLVPTLQYSSDKHGMSITAMLQRLTLFLRSPMLLVLMTTDQEIVGFFSPFPLRLDAKSAASSAPLDISFVCQLEPEQEAFWWTGANALFMNVTHKQIVIGGNDVAIFVDQDLRKGQSRKSASFGSPRLVRDELGDFLITLVEIWILKDS